MSFVSECASDADCCGRALHRPAIWLLAFAATLLIWQIVLATLLLRESVGLVGYTALHVGGCGVLAVWLRQCWSAAEPHASHAAVQLLGWATLAGPLGAAISFAMLLPSVPACASTKNLPENTADQPARATIDRLHTELLDRRIRLEGARHIRPLVDVLADGTQLEKLSALGVIYRRYEAKLSVLLKLALRDSETSVRVLAATVTAKLHATYSRAVGEHQLACASEAGTAKDHVLLGQARLAYADSGLLEPARACALIEAAVGDLDRASELDPADQMPFMLATQRRGRLEAST